MHDPSGTQSDSTDQVRRAMLAGLGGVAAGMALTGRAHAGQVTPPVGPVGPTMKSLDRVEPRTPVGPSTTPGNATATYRILQPGSYYLAGNVTGESGKHGIEIVADNVTLDLMGFAITGVPGSLNGIRTGNADLIIRHGSVTGFGDEGIYGGGLGARSMLIEAVHASVNGRHGIDSGRDSVVRDCTARSNGMRGFQVSGNSIVEGCTARSNGSYGFHLSSHCVASLCSAKDNADAGFFAFGRSLLDRCSATQNSGDGIIAQNESSIHRSVCSSNSGSGIVLEPSGCNVSECRASFNGVSGVTATFGGHSVEDSHFYSNGLHGVEVSFGTRVIRNLCHNNGIGASGAGVYAGGLTNTIEENYCRENDLGIQVTQTQNFIARNVCVGNSPNFAVVAGNYILAVAASAAGLVQGNSGGISPGSSDPNANYSLSVP